MLKPKFLLVTGVLAVHVLAVWALQQGLLRVVPPAPQPLLTVTVVAPAPPAEVPQPAKLVKPKPPPKDQVADATPRPQQTVLPQSQALQTAQVAPQVAEHTSPAPLYAHSETTAAAPAPAGAVAAPRAQAAPPPAPVAPQVDLPSSNAAYLNNPQPVYPPISERRREYGRVLLTVVVDAQGRAKSVQLKTSSGYERLDQAAIKAVSAWTFVPGKRGGVPTEMAVDVPIRFGPQ